MTAMKYNKKEDIDHRWAWVILVVVTFVQGASGIAYLCGLFYRPLLETFETNPVWVTWCLSSQYGFLNAAG